MIELNEIEDIEVNLNEEKTINVEFDEDIKNLNDITEIITNENIRQENESIRQSNEKERLRYYNQIKQDALDGKFKGDKGDPGEKGDKGDPGEIGPQGPMGEPGDVKKEIVLLNYFESTGYEAGEIGDKYYNTTENKIYTKTTATTWEEPETPEEGIIYINLQEESFYYYQNVEGGQMVKASSSGEGDTLPIGSIVEYEGNEVPKGYEKVGDNPNIYSTDETKTNKKWKDGKPIYRKYVSIQNPSEISGSGKTDQLFVHNIPNIDEIVEINHASWTDGKAKAFFPILTSSNHMAVIYNADKDSIVIRTIGEHWGSNWILNAVVEYTKTTDAATKEVA